MLRLRSALFSVSLGLLVAAPIRAQSPQFKADVTRVGDEPFDGTIYFGIGRMRIEGTSDGEPFTAIINSQANSIIVLMPDDQVYMTMDLGSAPFSAPGASAMDPANPCASGELTECRSLGTQTINGQASRGWEYTRDGERETGWISNELRFPVRTVEADGSTTDFTNVVMGSQPASLFEPPAGYTAMDVGGLLGGFGGRGGPPGGRAGRGQAPPAVGRGQAPAQGRGQAAGRGAAPTGGRGQAAGRGAPAPAPGGVPPDQAAQLRAQLQAMGLPPDQVEAAIAQMGLMGTATNSAPWEAIQGWVVDIVVTASGSRSGTRPEGEAFTETYSARYTGSVPIPYGTPAVGAASGPAWQLVPGLGSATVPLTGSSTQQYHSETVRQPGLPCNDAFGGDGWRAVTDIRGSGELRETDPMNMMTAQARFEISGDLTTYSLFAGAPVAGTEQTTSTTTYMNRCPNSPAPATETSTREREMSPSFNVTGQPLPAAPGTIQGSARVPMQFGIGMFSGELEANVEWTLRPVQ